MKFNHYTRLNRNPDPDGLGGGGAGDGSPSGEGASAFDASQYVPKAEFERVTGELGEFRNKYSSLESDYNGFKSKFSGLFSEGKEGKADKEPNFADYKTRGEQGVLEYIDARAAYLANKQFGTLQEQQAKQREAQNAQANLSAAYQKHIGRIPDAQKRYKDFDQVTANAAMALPDGRDGKHNVLADVLDSDHSADLQYKLSKNPGDLYKLVSAYNESPAKGARMLGAFEAQIEASRAAEKAAMKKAGVRPTIQNTAEADGNPNESQELDAIAREVYGLKKKD